MLTRLDWIESGESRQAGVNSLFYKRDPVISSYEPIFEGALLTDYGVVLDLSVGGIVKSLILGLCSK